MILSRQTAVAPISKNIGLEQALAKVYLFCLPIRMMGILSGVMGYFKGASVYFDFLLHALGLMLMLGDASRRRVEEYQGRRTFQFLAGTVAWFILSSLLMAVVIQSTYGNIGKESAFNGILGMCVYFVQYVLMVAYNRRVFRILSETEIRRQLRRISVVLLVLGYIQIAALKLGREFASFYNSMDILDVLVSTNMPKLSLTGTEGASVGTILSAIVLPCLFSDILVGNRSFWIKMQILLWIPVIYYTSSSTAFIVAVVCSTTFFWLYAKHTTHKTFSVIFANIALWFLMLSLLFPGIMLAFLSEDVRQNISYLLFSKATDLNNGSTVTRIVPLVVSWRTFLAYPVLGVGNGLQGYFYERFLPSWALNTPGSEVAKFLDIARDQIANGGVFFPSLLSGYGMIGCALVAVYVFKLRIILRSQGIKHRYSYYYFLIAIWGIVFIGFQGDFVGNYMIWFVLSLPYLLSAARGRDEGDAESVKEGAL